jgi:hypothetical protein
MGLFDEKKMRSKLLGQGPLNVFQLIRNSIFEILNFLNTTCPSVINRKVNLGEH